MSKLGSLLRAMFSEGMELFKFRSKDSASGFSKIAFPIVIAVVIMGAMSYYAFQMAIILDPLGLNFIMPVLAIVMLSVIGLFEGIYKVQGLLFDCRDNDLLFSLPISRRRVLAVRVLKLVVFQVLYNALFALPVLAVYGFFEHAGPLFWLISALMLILAPLVPTAIAVLLGYIVRKISVHFRFQKIAQVIGTLAIIAVVIIIAFNSEGLFTNFLANASSINDFIVRIYYPAGAYANLIQAFSPADFFGLLAVTILPFAAVIWLCSHGYFRLISRSKNHQRSGKAVSLELHRSTPTAALIKKELSRYFSSVVFIFNTAVSPILLLIVSIALALNAGNLGNIFGGEEGSIEPGQLFQALPIIYSVFLIFCALTTSITSSSISLEGKSFNITKSLPISTANILRAKVIASLVIALPPMLIADAIFLAVFATGPLDFIFIPILTVLAPLLSGLLGLLVNLKYPKMSAKDDTEVVKQSMSSMISVFAGFGSTFILSIATFAIGIIANPLIFLAIILAVLDAILWRLLKTRGVRLFRAIEA